MTVFFSTTLRFLVRTGIDGEAPYFIKEYSINGTAQSPFATTIGEPISQFSSGLITSRVIGGSGGSIFTSPTQGSGGGGTTTGGGNGDDRTLPGGKPPTPEPPKDNIAAS